MHSTLYSLPYYNTLDITINHKILIVNLFSDSMGNAKIKRTKIMHIINANAVRGRLSENDLTQKFIIFDTKYLRFTVHTLLHLAGLKRWEGPDTRVV